MAKTTTFKVSVIVPTYRSTAHLDDLVDSLDRQTMPQGDFEVLLVDDGSPDDTHARLEGFAATRPNYRVFRLPPSGWPSRPRNHGIDEACGEYVVFIDHDDRLFPDALRAGYALAARAGADVLDGKESKSDTPGWAMRDVMADVGNAIDQVEPHPLLPMNPHKMFRTAFLREKGIRFPEGGRQIWEDIFFDIAAHARADVVSLMVETPFYYWNRPPHATTSTTFHDDLDEYLDAVARVFRWIDEELQQERFAQLLPRFRAYQLHMRLLPLFRWGSRTPEERERICAFTAELLPTIPDDADLYLDGWRRITTALLRAGRFDLIDAHERTFPVVQCAPSTAGARWSADGVSFDLDLQWRFTAKEAAPVRYRDGRAILALTEEVAAFAAEHGLSADVTDEVTALTYSVDRRWRTEKIDWLLFAGSGAELIDIDGAAQLRATVPVHWSLADDGPGRLGDGPWDFYVRTIAMRTRNVRQVRTDDSTRGWAVTQGVVASAYRAQNGGLSIDVGQTLASVIDDEHMTAVASPQADGVRIHIALPQVTAFGDLDVPGAFVDASGGSLGPCRLIAGDGRARVEGTVPTGAATFAAQWGDVRSHVRFRLFGRTRLHVIRDAESGSPMHPRRLALRAWRMLPARLRERAWKLRHHRR
ncbi:glycosyltransferase [Microbacterium horticulturae]|uniref:Glycosyltransferase n=1 Tax=Microbacterium horticulturae TaxID=3028316 RepID=A0ABY8BY80_9MICO|nr:glycosyltransferase [Microbacterium sp. KACC 23027]WEG07543.1 glycosyltransferase [Microbacterium sp. KACC 23027]